MLGLGSGINKLSSAEAAAIAARSGGYLLDTYSGSAAAYSLRQLSSTYSGNAVKVRRASDNAEADIRLVNGELDTTGLATHCGSSDGFVSVWYDQSSRSNDATQTTASKQPKIYDGTTGVVTENGKPIMNDPEQGEIFSASFTGNSSATICSVLTGSNGYQDIFLKSGSNYYFRTQSDVTTVGSYVNGIGTVTTYANGSLQGNLSRKEANDLVENSQTNLFATCDLSGFTNLIMGTSSRGGMNMQEVIIWNSDQSSNRTNIEDNINIFYSIY